MADIEKITESLLAEIRSFREREVEKVDLLLKQHQSRLSSLDNDKKLEIETIEDFYGKETKRHQAWVKELEDLKESFSGQGTGSPSQTRSPFQTRSLPTASTTDIEKNLEEAIKNSMDELNSALGKADNRGVTEE